MNYGQHRRWGPEQKRTYRVVLSVPAFVRRVSGVFEAFRQGEMADDDDDLETFPELLLWRALGYPALNALVERHRGLLVRLVLFYEFEVSDALFDFKPQGGRRVFSVNAIESVVFDGAEVEISGIAYEVSRARKAP